MLGHHRGDVEENVLSNALKGCGVLSLSGMGEASTAHGVRIWRPYLGLEKKHIFAYAREHGVPYFKDTTPRWSTRGKIRAQLLPLLQDIYGAGVGSNLALLAEESREMAASFNAALLRPTLATVERCSLGVSLPLCSGEGGDDLRTRGFMFWRALLRELLHSLGVGALREPSIRELMQRLAREGALKERAWLELRKDLLCYLGGGRLYLLHPHFSDLGAVDARSTGGGKERRRPHQPRPWGEHGTPIALGGDPQAFGPFRARAWIDEAAAPLPRCRAGQATLPLKFWPGGRTSEVPMVPELFERCGAAAGVASGGSLQGTARLEEAIITYDLVVSRAALEAGGGALVLETAVLGKHEKLRETSAWRRANRRLGQLVPRVELPALDEATVAGLPESDSVLVRVRYDFDGAFVPLKG